MIEHIPNLVSPLNSIQVAHLKKEYALQWDYVFNPDNCRLQCPVDIENAMAQQIWTSLHKRGFTRGRLCGGVVIMKSLAGCKQQQWHCDYDPSIRYTRHKPLGVLVAFENNTRFVTPTKTFYLCSGDAIVFDADVVHAGAAYDQENIRMHMYLDTATHQHEENKTYLLV